MPSDDFIAIRPQPRLDLVPVLNILNSMIMLSYCRQCASGSAEISLTEEEKLESEVIFQGLYHGIIPPVPFDDFSAYLDFLKNRDPLEIRHRIISYYRRKHDEKTGSMKELSTEEIIQKVLKSPENFLSFLGESYDPSQYSPETERKAYELLIDPPEMKKRIHSFISRLWNGRFDRRWKVLKADYAEFIGKTDISFLRNKTDSEAILSMTGMEIDLEKWTSSMDISGSPVFVPSFDVRNGNSKMVSAGTLYIFFDMEAFEKRRFDAQLSDIDELARKLGAISDTNRLNVLKYIASKGEACSQDILKDLGFSQSAVSRHLQQLSATGIVSERRQISAKYYRVNGEYLRNVLNSVTAFLGI